jgi:hypothetical protein
MACVYNINGKCDLYNEDRIALRISWGVFFSGLLILLHIVVIGEVKDNAMETRKILINDCYGGYGLSKAVYDELGIEWDDYGYYEGKGRDDPELIRAVEKIGLKESSGQCANLKIEEIPADAEWVIDDHDGNEWIAEPHRTWGR